MTNRWHIVNSKPGYLLPPIQAETKGDRDSSIHKNASKLNRFTVCNWNSETYLDVSMVRKREITTYSNKSELNLENSIHDIHLQDGTLRKPVRQVQKKSCSRRRQLDAFTVCARRTAALSPCVGTMHHRRPNSLSFMLQDFMNYIFGEETKSCPRGLICLLGTSALSQHWLVAQRARGAPSATGSSER